MDRQVVDQKLEALRHALRRVAERCPDTVEALMNDLDAQDVVALNLTRAVQLCVDIGAHLIAGTQMKAPDTMGQVFDVLAQTGIVDADLADRLKKAVGFRNIAVHNYQSIDWAIVHSICQQRLKDFDEYAKAVSARMAR